MKISFVINMRMPTEKAHGYQIAKMCEMLALEGADVSLVVPTRKNKTEGDIFSYYDVRKNFLVKYVPTFDALAFLWSSRLGFYAQAVSFILALRRESISRDTVIVTRNPEIAWLYGRKKYRIFYDAHSFPAHGTGLLKWLLKNAEGIIANSNGTANAFRSAGFDNVLVAPNAVDLANFALTESVDRGSLGLPHGRIAMYVGHLYGWKGVNVIVDAARCSKIENLIFVFVGGTDSDLASYRAETKDVKNILFMGRRPHHDVATLMKSADVLLLPNIASTQESVAYTSPIKMFEYMASGVPIVASRLPSICEVLNDSNSILVEPGNPNELLRGIELSLILEATARAAQAKKDVQSYTWDARALKILRFINKQS